MNSEPQSIGKVALIHDWLTGMRGGEKVLESFCELFPDADIFTLVYKHGSISPLIARHRIFESPLAKIPRSRDIYRKLLPLFPWAIESFDLKGYDLILSSSSAVAKGIIPPPDALHIAYLHTPMRYIWDIRGDYIGPSRLDTVSRFVAGWAAHYLRNWDVSSSARVDNFVANSRHVKLRIGKYYHRSAEVIYPPVDVKNFPPGKGKGDYFLVVSALVPYKRVDLAIAACNKLGLKLIIVGDGGELPHLRDIAGDNVEFLGFQDTKNLAELYQNAIALIHPAEEDFGIAPVEAQAAGRPVIAFNRGGARETVVIDGDSSTGFLFAEQSVESLVDALRSFDASNYDSNIIRRNSLRFGKDRFLDEFRNFVTSRWYEANK